MTAGTAAHLSSALEFAPLPTAVSCARLMPSTSCMSGDYAVLPRTPS